MSKSLTVAWREFKQTVFRRIFLVAIIGLPLLIGGAIVLAGFMIATYEEPPLIGTIAVVDRTGELTDAARHEFAESTIERDRQQQIEQSMQQMKSGAAPGGMSPAMGDVPALKRGEIRIDVQQIDPDDPSFSRDALQQRVRNGEFLAAAVVDPDLLEAPNVSTLSGANENTADATPRANADAKPGATASGEDSSDRQFLLFVAPDLKSDHVGLIERRLGESIVRVRTNRAGFDPDAAMAMLRRPRPTTQRMLESGEEAAETEATRVFKEMIPMAFMGLIFIGVFTSGQHLLMSTIEEKSNRVMEVLLSAVSPMQLMTGKILGHGAVGLLLVAVYGSVGIAGIIAFSAMHLIDPIALVYLAIYFFMGYFMVASLFAAVGAAVTDLREANTLITPVMMLVWIPWILWLPISKDPNGLVGTIFSFIPPVMPFVMILRIGADEVVPTWQIVASIVWGAICVIGMVWMAAKIFRVGVLMYGKPPTPLQLIKWLRYS